MLDALIAFAWSLGAVYTFTRMMDKELEHEPENLGAYETERQRWIAVVLMAAFWPYWLLLVWRDEFE